MKHVEYAHMVLGPEDCPLFHCWRLKLWKISFRVHHFLRSGPPEVQHDHTWWFVTFVLKGSYLDVTPHGTERMRAGRVAFRPTSHRHAVTDCEGCWTFVINGPTVRTSNWWNGDAACNQTEAQMIEGAFACPG